MSFQDRESSHPPVHPATSFAPSSWSSAVSVSEAIASYRRSQYIITGQNVSSSDEMNSVEDDLEEGRDETDRSPGLFGVDEEEEEDLTPLPLSRDEPTMSNLEWDEDLVRPAAQPTSVRQHRVMQWRTNSESTPLVNSFTHLPSSPAEGSSEQTPLLQKAQSKTSILLKLPASRRGSESDAVAASSASLRQGTQKGKEPLKGKISSISTRSEKPIASGESTFGQTLFNSIAILLGFGMLSEPFAFAYAGWVCGTLLVICYGLINCYTAKILARIMLEDPQIRTYADIGNKAFGHRTRFLTSSLFCLELFSVGVVLVTLYADSLHSIVPTYSADTYKIIGLIILLPSVFVPLSVLSYASILGILSTLLIIGVLFLDGLSKHTPPGSLWSPADTSLGIASVGKLGVAFGLIMAGFSAHAVLPSLARDMANPKQFDSMINWAFLAATVIYGIIGASGYLMFGNFVSDEVSKDMLATPGYNALMNKIAVWSLVIMPLTKFALSTRPVVITLEIIFGLESNSVPQVSGNDRSISTLPTAQRKRSRTLNQILVIVERTVFVLLVVAFSIFIPEFSAMMAFLGSFSAFLLCVIGPISAKVALEGKCSWLDAGLLVMGVVMATWGTVAAFVA